MRNGFCFFEEKCKDVEKISGWVSLSKVAKTLVVLSQHNWWHNVWSNSFS